MEFFIIGWVAYLIYIATRTEEQRQVQVLALNGVGVRVPSWAPNINEIWLVSMTLTRCFELKAAVKPAAFLLL